jgi:hypothetical protein
LILSEIVSLSRITRKSYGSVMYGRGGWEDGYSMHSPEHGKQRSESIRIGRVTLVLPGAVVSRYAIVGQVEKSSARQSLIESFSSVDNASSTHNPK